MATETRSDLRFLVAAFADQLAAAIEAQATERAKALVLAALGPAPRGGPGRPPSSGMFLINGARRPRRPLQLCPVPGCTNPAAPIFGMVCAKHKGLARSKIKRYREARRRAKAVESTGLSAGSAKAALRRASRRVSPKLARTRRLQGQYLGALRAIKADDRAKVKAVAREKGVAEALKAARELAPTPSPSGFRG